MVPADFFIAEARAKDPWGGTRAGFETEATLDRKDYGIVWNKALDAGGALLALPAAPSPPPPPSLSLSGRSAPP
jgi:hypothetical protein